MIFCHAPWTNIDISSQGNIAPCCKYQSQCSSLNINQNSIAEYMASDELQSIKQDFRQGQWPPGCIRCNLEEKHGIASKRQLDLQRWGHHYDKNIENNSVVTASISFGNTCNLKCLTCGPKFSSRWQKEYQEIVGTDISPNHFYKNEIIEEISQYLPNLVHLDISGGEPMLSGIMQQKKLLRSYVDNDRAKDMTLHYTTNATVWPDDEWWNLWSHFKEIEIQLSLDGIGPRYEYIRFLANWEEVSRNVLEYRIKKLRMPNLRLSISHTVSAYNVLYLDEFFDWCEQNHLPKPWCGRVHTPVHLRPSVWCHDARDLIVKTLRSSPRLDVQNWAALIADTDDSSRFDEFKQRLHAHDAYRNLSFVQTFPELSKFV